MSALLSIATHGPADPTKACIPFRLAVNGAAEAGIEAEVDRAGDAVVSIQDRYFETLTPLGAPSLQELMKAFGKGVRIHIHIRGGRAHARGASQADLAGETASTTRPELTRRSAEATNVLVFRWR